MVCSYYIRMRLEHTFDSLHATRHLLSPFSFPRRVSLELALWPSHTNAQRAGLLFFGTSERTPQIVNAD